MDHSYPLWQKFSSIPLRQKDKDKLHQFGRKVIPELLMGYALNEGED